MKNNTEDISVETEYKQAVEREAADLKSKFTTKQLAFADWVNVYAEKEAETGKYPACAALLDAEDRLYDIDPEAFPDDDLRHELGLPLTDDEFKALLEV